MPLTHFFARIKALITLLKASSSDAEVLLPEEIRSVNFRVTSENGFVISQKIRDELAALSAEFSLKARW